jgi:hypothetical protein
VLAPVLVLTAACAPALRRLPAGAGQPAPDAQTHYSEATRLCRDVRVLTAEIAVSGHVGGGRLRGHLLAGLAAPDSLRLEGEAPFGRPIFVLVARGGRGTLLLPRDGRVLSEASPAALLDALAGVSLSPADLLAIISGCGTVEAPIAGAHAYGDDWVRVDQQGGGAVYLHRADQRWQLLAALVPQPGGSPLRVDYADFRDGRPQAIRLTADEAPSSGGEGDRAGGSVDLRLELSQVEINTTLGPEAFTVTVPADAVPITLDELRRSGLLGAGHRQ